MYVYMYLYVFKYTYEYMYECMCVMYASDNLYSAYSKHHESVLYCDSETETNDNEVVHEEVGLFNDRYCSS